MAHEPRIVSPTMDLNMDGVQKDEQKITGTLSYEALNHVNTMNRGHDANEVDDDDDSNASSGSEEMIQGQRKQKNAHTMKRSIKRNLRRKQKKKPSVFEENGLKSVDDEQRRNLDIQIDYITASNVEAEDPSFSDFAGIFQKFQMNSHESTLLKQEQGVDTPHLTDVVPKEVETMLGEDERVKTNNKADLSLQDNASSLSKRKRKLLRRPTVAQLKQFIARPDLVEWVDVAALDPLFLLQLKATRHSVTVPRHWSAKSKYLQRKRGFLKPPFELPAFIKATGITEMRAALKEKEDNQKASQKMRARIRPKMGKLTVDYQKLHDAFFRFQTKPFLSIHGDLYYDGKEFEVKMVDRRPGALSESIRNALSIPPLAPPPWLLNMQRYGPPPSYPHLRLPGLNFPIPLGAQWGFHPGGWGRPPVDEQGRPLYGDVFASPDAFDAETAYSKIDKSALWGEMEEEEIVPIFEQETSEGEALSGGEEEEETELIEDMTTEAETLTESERFVTAGLETPDVIELRKRPMMAAAPASISEPKTLYTTLTTKETRPEGFLGSSRLYNLPQTNKANVDVALDPSELSQLVDNPTQLLQSKLDHVKRDQEPVREDMSDLVAEHAAKSGGGKKKKSSRSDEAAKKFKF